MAELGGEVAFRVSQQGAEQVATALQNVANATEKAGKSSSEFTRFVREQRQEQRIQGFVAREAAQSVQTLAFATIALTSSTANASKEAQQLTKSLLAGAASFQGADFAISALGKALGFAPGGVGTAIAGVIGLGTALYSFFDNSAEKAKALTAAAEEQRKAFDQLTTSVDAWNKRMSGATGESGVAATREERGISGARLAGLRAVLEANAAGRGTVIAPPGLSGAQEFAFIEEANKAIGRTYDENIRRLKELEALYAAIASASYDILVNQKQLNPAFEAAMKNAPKLYGETSGYRSDIGGFYKPGGGFSFLNTGRGFPKQLEMVKGITDNMKILDAELTKSNLKELQFISLLDQSVGTMRSAVALLGVETDSFIGKLLQAVDIATSMLRLYEGIKTISSVAGLLTGNPAAFVGGVGPPDFRRGIINTIGDAERKGIVAR